MGDERETCAGGIGALVDLGGNDRYVVKESGLGCAWFGTGLLWDAAGDDLAVSALGFPAESDWVLYASYLDRTLMRD